MVYLGCLDIVGKNYELGAGNRLDKCWPLVGAVGREVGNCLAQPLELHPFGVSLFELNLSL